MIHKLVHYEDGFVLTPDMYVVVFKGQEFLAHSRAAALFLDETLKDYVTPRVCQDCEKEV